MTLACYLGTLLKYMRKRELIKNHYKTQLEDSLSDMDPRKTKMLWKHLIKKEKVVKDLLAKNAGFARNAARFKEETEEEQAKSHQEKKVKFATSQEEKVEQQHLLGGDEKDVGTGDVRALKKVNFRLGLGFKVVNLDIFPLEKKALLRLLDPRPVLDQYQESARLFCCIGFSQ